MAAPKAVQDQLKRAEELHQQMYGAHEDPGQEPEDTSAEPEQTNETQEPESPQPAPEHEPVTPDPAGHADDESDLAEKYRKLDAAYRTLQGKYSKEVPALHDKVRNLQEQLITAQQAKADAEKSEQAAQAELGQVQSKLREEIGDEAADAVDEYTRSLVRSEMGKQKRPDEQTQGNSEVDRFGAILRRREPEFDSINHSQEFIQWLQTPNPSSGLPYQDTLNEAGRDLDVMTVLDLVQQFKHDQQPKPKPKPEISTPPEENLAPAKKGVRNPPQQQPKYTPQDYTDLQEQKRRGMWRGREAEFRALEAEIHAALTG